MRIFKKTTVKVFKCLMSLGGQKRNVQMFNEPRWTKKKCSNFKKKMRNFYCI